ncbi:uncharacterized protein [Pyrus communis]|uniref:uncharacterized protein n=1 Tax=Pyrus communis TaxID=23211 RepID=UPI0035C26DBC
MNRLSLEQVLKENNTRDPNSISTLKLNHKALSDVSCLGEFNNLERLDLSFNNLTSLEGLKSCINLKWLSVANNKLQSLKGIEGLSKLTVLNAGNNKLQAMDEIKSIVGLRAVILNDNEIASICRLEPLRELNTLVLSKNPIRDIGDSLKKVKSITKLSLSHCQLQTIEASLKFCIELKELRLAHNDIKGLPTELALNKKLQNLDLGNNVITRWSDLKIINSLVNLRNLNLQGNPVVEKDKLVKKIKKMLPNLHVFNARPIDKNIKSEKGARADEVNKSTLNAADKQETQTEEPKERDFKHHAMGEAKGGIENASDSDTKKSKRKRKGSKDNVSNNDVVVEGDEKRDSVKKKNRIHHMQNEDDPGNLENAGHFEKALQQKKQKKSPADTEDNAEVGKKPEKSKGRKGELDVIDDADTPFLELFSVDAEVASEKKVNDKVRDLGGLVTFPSKSKKAKNRPSTGSTLHPSPVDEIGTGGPSTWGDD